MGAREPPFRQLTVRKKAAGLCAVILFTFWGHGIKVGRVENSKNCPRFLELKLLKNGGQLLG
ncbi:hypothetical protein COXBURSA331_A0378 [Coxiella burnetii RSA 331]|nr:hypothetical protein COXBURSA331_A0378 [Coxiella burnetii RSA 331]EDR35457.1 hypothetical protein COXBURSA334_1806 [Coxiella burnetii Q321]